MKENGKFWVQIPVNLISIKDEGILKILIQLKHLENLKNNKVSHQFLANVLNTSISTVKRRLSLLKELNLIKIESGKKSHAVNTYSINSSTYDSFVNKINSFRSLEDRIVFIDNYFDNRLDDNKKENSCTKQESIIYEFKQLHFSDNLNRTNCRNDILEILQNDDYQNKIDNAQILLTVLNKYTEVITKEDISNIMGFFIDNATIDQDIWSSKL